MAGFSVYLSRAEKDLILKLLQQAELDSRADEVRKNIVRKLTRYDRLARRYGHE